MNKFAKFGITLASLTILGAVPVTSNLLAVSNVAYAEENPAANSVTYRIHYFLNDVQENGGVPSYTDIAPYKEGKVAQGETITEVAPQIEGYTVSSWSSDDIMVTYDKFTSPEVWHDSDWVPSDGFFYDKVQGDTQTPPSGGDTGGDTQTPPS
ncbi:hypothetical protein, partial [Streptococcus suis]|uniref:hypothetical protein n=1 Tax=Streptococcus suis TaxID=1307 RepID=UPI001ABED8AB|nr:hypothetical protein [Streptococcus suis]